MLGVGSDEVTPEATLKNDLGADSLDVVEIVMECEKRLNIAISDSQMDEIKTVADLERICQECLKSE
jgi:acyl carrier protein